MHTPHETEGHGLDEHGSVQQRGGAKQSSCRGAYHMHMPAAASWVKRNTQIPLTTELLVDEPTQGVN